MVFTENSGLVKVWVRLVYNGTYTRDQVPDMYNMREVVYSVLDSLEEEVNAA